ncbi:hypothetical protein SS50377_26694 [Spironucleus salmonicida]|uniref:Uncharacterized protein n=1 Tax=Spironucleus salmonicida TaxID=348837 RepID=V6LY66_9EUKA|nr:hypothetical protein SS50377_26694 [Spironucleus salmonicida]|eukprot:EST49168.1 Hypothetical protein SS50377_10381 [Spironucleus salmonicida]
MPSSIEEIALQIISNFFDKNTINTNLEYLCTTFIEQFDSNTLSVLDKLLFQIYDFKQLPQIAADNKNIQITYSIFSQLINRTIQEQILNQYTVQDQLSLIHTQIYVIQKYQPQNIQYYCQSILDDMFSDDSQLDFSIDSYAQILLFIAQNINYISEELTIVLIEILQISSLQFKIQSAKILLEKQLVDQDLKSYASTLINGVFNSFNQLQQENLGFLIQFLQHLIILLHIGVELQDNIQDTSLNYVLECLLFALRFSVDTQYEEVLCLIYSLACLIMKQLSLLKDFTFILYKQDIFSNFFNLLLQKVNDVYLSQEFQTETKQYLQNFIHQYLVFVDYLFHHKITLPNAFKNVSQFNIPDSISYNEQNIDSLMLVSKFNSNQSKEELDERQENKTSGTTYQVNSSQKIKQLENKILTTSFGNTLQQQLEYCKLIISLDELLPEYGQVIQFYSKSELPSSILILILNLFTVEDLNTYQQYYNLITHPGFISSLSVIYRFRKQPQTLKTLSLVSFDFWKVIFEILEWFTTFYSKDDCDVDVNYDTLTQSFIMLISLLNRVVIYSGSILIQKLLTIKFIDVLTRILSINQIANLENNTNIKIASILNQIFNYIIKFKNVELMSKEDISWLSSISNISYYNILNSALEFTISNQFINAVISQQILVYLCQVISKIVFLIEDAAVYFSQQLQCLSSLVQTDALLGQTKDNVQKQQNEMIYDQDIIFAICSLLGSLLYQQYQFGFQWIFKEVILDPANQEIIVRKLLTGNFPQHVDVSFYLFYVVLSIQQLINGRNIKNEEIGNLIDNFYFVLLTQANYSINVYDLMFVWPGVFYNLNSYILGKIFLAKLLLSCFKGCQPRKEKKLQFIDQTVDFRQNSNINLKFIANEVCGNLYCQNEKADMDLTRHCYLLLLSSLSIDDDLCYLIVIDNQTSLFQILQSQGFIKSFLLDFRYQQYLFINCAQLQLESSSTIFDINYTNNLVQHGIIPNLMDNVQSAPTSMCVSPLVLIFSDIILKSVSLLKYTFNYKNLYIEFIEFCYQISQTWQIQKQVINKQQQSDNINKMLIYQQLYPNTNLSNLFKQSNESYFDAYFQFQLLYKVFFSCYTSQLHELTLVNKFSKKSYRSLDLLQQLPAIEFLIISNILFVCFDQIQHIDFILILENYNFFKILSIFQFSQLVSNKIQSFCIDDQDHLDNQMLKVFTEQIENINQQFENSYNIILQQCKLLQVHYRLASQKRSISIKNIKQFELLLYLSILQNPTSIVDIFDDALKQVQQDFALINFKYDPLFSHREQRQKFNISQIHKSQLQKIYEYDDYFMQTQENDIDSEYIVILSELFGLELLIRFTIRQLQQCEPTQYENIIQKFSKMLLKVNYKPKFNDRVIDSLILTKQLINISIYIDDIQIKLQIFICLLMFNSFDIDSHATLLFFNGYFDDLQSKCYTIDILTEQDIFILYCSCLNKALSKIQQAYSYQKHSKFRFKQQFQISKNVQSNPLLQSLFMIDDSLQNQQIQNTQIYIDQTLNIKNDSQGIFLNFINNTHDYLLNILQMPKVHIKLLTGTIQALLKIDCQIHQFCEHFIPQMVNRYLQDNEDCITFYYDLFTTILQSVQNYCTRCKLDTIVDDQVLMDAVNLIINTMISKSMKSFKGQYATNFIKILITNTCHMVNFDQIQVSQEQLLKLFNEVSRTWRSDKIQQLQVNNSQFQVKIRKGWRRLIAFIELK